MKKHLVAILLLSLSYLGVYFLLTGDSSDRWGQAGIALLWGVAFHFVTLKFFPSAYIFSDQNRGG